ncbi:Woronin body major protein [Neofusicoccum parvum]|uniref:Putative woronin body major protein n=1 Tax=Botryosphaeria parva (strain UCR-NP2) TaxID=1287680 RepID=R1ENQ6_BOTPV|nr:putative woronin body major protein [Neofusicoccum parvum UCRNP2]GME64051.1 Woronin body major protein [Neofusicoccum parvum]
MGRRLEDLGSRVPIPFSVFPSSYRSDAVSAEESQVKVEGEVNLSEKTSRVGREGHEARYSASEATSAAPSRKEHRFEEEVRVYEKDRHRPAGRREEEVHIYERDERRHPRSERIERDRYEVDIERERSSYQEPFQRYDEAQINVKDRTYDVRDFKERTYDRDGRPVFGASNNFAESQLDTTERQFRERTRPIVDESRYGRDFAEFRYSQTAEEQPRYGARAEQEVVDRRYPESVRVESTTSRTTTDPPKHKRDMGYYDDDGHYHSFRHGLHKAADRILHPIHGHSHHSHHHKHDHPSDKEEVVIKETYTAPSKPRVSASAPPPPPPETFVPEPRSPRFTAYTETARTSTMSSANTITIPCHHIRIGDLLILQGRPCQVIRITTSSQTGQHRYLGVDLFTKQLHEESSFISNPAPSVIVQNMLGPVFKQYRVLDIREDGRIVSMTETGDIKQGLPVLDQSGLSKKLADSFDNGRGSIRVLVIADSGNELVVDYKVVHGSRL